MLSCWRPPRDKATQRKTPFGGRALPFSEVAAQDCRPAGGVLEPGAGIRKGFLRPRSPMLDMVLELCTRRWRRLLSLTRLCLRVAGLCLPTALYILSPTWQGQEDTDAESDPVASCDPTGHPPPLL